MFSTWFSRADLIDQECKVGIRLHNIVDVVRKPSPRRSQDPHVHLASRFAFYGRMSTAEYQDRYSSRLWQREV
jgi:hypothetical protein